MSLLMIANKASVIILVKNNPSATWMDFNNHSRFKCCITEDGFNNLKSEVLMDKEKAQLHLSELLSELELEEKNFLK